MDVKPARPKATQQKARKSCVLLKSGDGQTGTRAQSCISVPDGNCRGDAHTMTDYRVHAGEAKEDQVTAAIEKYTSQVPSSAYLGLAIASIAASITLQLTQKEKAPAALFVGQWVAPFLLLGIYNKMVKQHGSDAATR
jgi:hypothetical protein